MSEVVTNKLMHDVHGDVDYGLVSIIMPNFNSESFIERTIDSVIAQKYKNWELIVVDDCSTDNSLSIVKSYRDDRITVTKNEVNSGAAKSRNVAIHEAKGMWIAFLDSDDVWCENKLTDHLSFMVKRGVDFSFTHYSVINGSDEHIVDFTPMKSIYTYTDILKHCSIGCSTVIYNANSLGKVYMPEDAIKREDFACWLKILSTGVNAECLHQKLTSYRVHGNSVSSNKFKMVKYQWKVYRDVQKLSVFKSAYFMCHWAIRGLLKYA